ncbi:MAG: hypothetical protein EBR26_01820 [Microbacteriaceae bacterium]|nr:hypothetical protein [Microbacteriaceae bacterium]
MKLSTKKFAVFISTLALALVGIGAITGPAHAADCPYPVEDLTANDNPKTNIRLVSPSLSTDNAIRRYDFEGQFTLDCDWFGVGMRFFQVYVPYDQPTTLTFNATNAQGVPLVNTKLKLRLNKRYSSSNAPIIVNGVSARRGTETNDGGYVFATTDVNGNATFLVKTDSTRFPACDRDRDAVKLPDAPTRYDQDTPLQRTGELDSDCFSQLIPELTGEKTDSQDFVELHYFDPATLNNSVDSATINVLAPTLDETNSIQGDGTVQMYAPIGSKQIIAFQATKSDGTWARNVPVRVRINLGNSGSNAKVSAGIWGNTGNGLSTTLTPADSTKTAEDQLVLTGTTDAFGIVTFQLSNTDTVGITPPATKTTPVPVTGARYARIFAEVIDKSNTGSSLELHFFKPAPPTSITVAASGRKITVTINNAVGKTSTVSITGKSKVTLKPSKAKQVLTYAVTRGVKKVTVTANGKTVTKTFTIK